MPHTDTPARKISDSNPRELLRQKIHTCPELIDLIGEIGFLPMFDCGIAHFNADALTADECRYRVLPDGGWEWPLWRWKGPVVTEGGCVYGKFFGGKAGFVSRQWWPDFCNWRRSSHPLADEQSEAGAIQQAILDTLHERGSLVSRDLRAACGLVGRGMRSRFDAQVAQLQMACRIVTEDFVYPRDRHGHEYGWGLSLLAIPERLLGPLACRRSPQQSRQRIASHLQDLLPDATPKQLDRLIG